MTMTNMNDLYAKAERNIRQALEDYGKHTYQQTVLEDVTDAFIKTLARDSVWAKRDLRALFRKSPVWDEELNALVINGTRTHNPDAERICELGYRIVSRNGHRFVSDQELWALRLFYDPDMPDADREKALAAINEIAPKAYAPGKKRSRVFKQMCVALGVADETAGSEFQRLYAQFADELTARKIDFKLYVSINPAHFLTMSNPKGDRRGTTLTSCHSFNSTDYSYNCGCAGYARDTTSFIVFTVEDPTNPESFNNRKTTRQIFAYRPGSGLLLQSRMYNTSGGTTGAVEDSTLYRDLIQREISALENQPNLWKTYPSYGEYAEFVKEGPAFGGYADWTYDSFGGRISFRADCDMDNTPPLIVGTSGLCVKCGCEISDGMYCEDCAHGTEFCEDCEEYCDEVFPAYNPHGRRVHVCADCLEDHYIRCENCGEDHHSETMTYVEDADEYYCEDCLSDVAEQCEDCGKWFLRNNMSLAYDRHGYEVWVCDGCVKHYVACEECGEFHHRDSMHEVTQDDGTVVALCDACYEKLEAKEEEAV